MRKNRAALFNLVLVFTLSACGSVVDSIEGSLTGDNCKKNGNNVFGRVNFTPFVTLKKGARIVIESSNDGFGSVLNRGYSANQHGLRSVPFELCVDTNKEFILRAYQDTDPDALLDPDYEGQGRWDGSSGADDNFITHTILYSDQKWNTLNDVVIDLDHEPENGNP